MILGVLKECIFLLNKMSFYLLFGFLVAGIIHVFVKEDLITRHLGKHNIWAVIKAALFGIPLPLCSCSVVPTALSLRKDGASKGSILSFLISTPTTGIDSIFATYSLLGGVFTIFRIVASFVAGALAGLLSILFVNDDNAPMNQQNIAPKSCCQHHRAETIKSGFKKKILGVFRYAFIDLMKDAGGWIMIGIIVGGVISYFIPQTFIEQYLGSLWQSIFIMMVVGIPMYVCSAGSLPIAAALMLKGMNPAAAFVFLFVGPATNSASLTVILKELGLKSVLIFLSSIIVTSISLGVFLNAVWLYLDINIADHFMQHSESLPKWIEVVSSLILSTIVFVQGISLLKKKMSHESQHDQCHHN